MKKVFQSSEVAHIWAQQKQESGRNSDGRIFFEGGTIYSYGRHFPIATIEGNDVLFTMRGYSSSTAKHKGKAWGAISDKNIIDCFEVPVKYYNDKKPLNKQSFTSVHEKNINEWKGIIVKLFGELGNNRNRDKAGRINSIGNNIDQLQKYCAYFKIPVKDKELKKLIALYESPNFEQSAKEAKAKAIAAHENKMLKAKKAFTLSIELWRDFNNDGLTALPDNIKELSRYYQNNVDSLTRLRYNKSEKRVETSKGIKIPVAIAKRAYTTLNGCLEGVCDSLEIPVLDYIITKTTKDTVIAGCHTIPKEDIRYIAELLNWK